MRSQGLTGAWLIFGGMKEMVNWFGDDADILKIASSSSHFRTMFKDDRR